MDLKAILHKKVAGIPAVYLIGAAVAVFAFIAWKLKPAASMADDTTVGTESSDNAGTDLTGVTTGDNAGSVYDSLKTAGTVVVAPSTDTTDTTTTVKTNATWISDGTAWLVMTDKATGSAANAALTKYVNAQDRSYDEQYLVDLWYAQGGPPPDGVDPGGAVGAKPAKTQGTPPLTHTVQGTSDNTYGDIATLYYGHNEQATYDLVQAANVDKIGTSGPFSPGTKIVVPAYHIPKMYVLPKDMSNTQIAAANGITQQQFIALNNTSTAQWKKGASVRVA